MKHHLESSTLLSKSVRDDETVLTITDLPVTVSDASGNPLSRQLTAVSSNFQALTKLLSLVLVSHELQKRHVHRRCPQLKRLKVLSAISVMWPKPVAASSGVEKCGTTSDEGRAVSAESVPGQDMSSALASRKHDWLLQSQFFRLKYLCVVYLVGLNSFRLYLITVCETIPITLRKSWKLKTSIVEQNE
ncbi:hypothetical protein YC2023_023526 [Brassica napus]